MSLHLEACHMHCARNLSILYHKLDLNNTFSIGSGHHSHFVCHTCSILLLACLE